MELNQVKDGTYELDLRSYEGPHLYLYVTNAMDKLESGETLKLILDDNYSRENLAISFGSTSAYEVLKDVKEGTTYQMLVKKK